MSHNAVDVRHCHADSSVEVGAVTLRSVIELLSNVGGAGPKITKTDFRRIFGEFGLASAMQFRNLPETKRNSSFGPLPRAGAAR